MAATSSAAHYRITGSIWGEELTSDRPTTSPGGFSTGRGGRSLPPGIPEEFQIGTPETDATAQDVWTGAWREAVHGDATDLWGMDSSSLMPVRSRSAASANLPVVRRDLEAVEDFCLRLEARQHTHIKVHSEKIMEVIAKPIESKLSALEAKQPQLEWQLTDMSGTMRALGEQVQLQRRASDAVEAALVRWRKQLESEARARYEELRKEFLNVSEVLRQETLVKIQNSKVQERSVLPRGAEWATQQELAELRQEMRLMVDGAAVDKPGITRQELNSTIELLKQELRLEMRHFVDAAGHGDQLTGDVRRDLDSFREELVSLKARDALSGGRGVFEVEPVLHMAAERAERAAEKVTTSAMEQIMEELRVRGNAINDSATLEIQRNVHKLEAEFERWQHQVDITTQNARAQGDHGEQQASIREIALFRDSMEQSSQEVHKVKVMVSSMAQSTVAAMADYDRKADDLITDVANLGQQFGSFATELSLRMDATERELLALRGQAHMPAAEATGTPAPRGNLTMIEEIIESDRSTLAELQKTVDAGQQQLLHMETWAHEDQVLKLQQEVMHLKASSEARLDTLMAEKDALRAESSTRKEDEPEKSREPPHAREETHHSEGFFAKAKHGLAHMLHLDTEKQDGPSHAPEPAKADADNAVGLLGNAMPAEEHHLSMDGLLAVSAFAGKMHAKSTQDEASVDLAKKSIGKAIDAHVEFLEKGPAAHEALDKPSVESFVSPAAPATREEAPHTSIFGSVKHGLAHMLHLDGEQQEHHHPKADMDHAKEEPHPVVKEHGSVNEDVPHAKEPDHAKEEHHPAEEVHHTSLLGSFKHGLAHMMHLDGEKQDAIVREPEVQHSPELALSTSSDAVGLASERLTEDTKVRAVVLQGTSFAHKQELPLGDQESSPQVASLEAPYAVAPGKWTCVCGHVLEADDIFCLRCGTKRPAPEEATSSHATSTQVEVGGWDDFANVAAPRRLLGGLNQDLAAENMNAASPVEEPEDGIARAHRPSLFSRMDLNQDGTINRQELEAAIRAGVIYQPERQASPKRQASPAAIRHQAGSTTATAAPASPERFNIATEEPHEEEAEENFNSCSDEEPSQTSPGLVTSLIQRMSRRRSA